MIFYTEIKSFFLLCFDIVEDIFLHFIDRPDVLRGGYVFDVIVLMSKVCLTQFNTVQSQLCSTYWIFLNI